MQVRSNLDTINEEDNFGDDDTWIEGVSRLEINNNNTGNVYEDGTCVQSSFNSIQGEANKRDSKRMEFKRTLTDLTKEFIVDYWRDSTPNMRVSIQFQVESGTNCQQKYDVRVSTDGMNLVVMKKSSDYMMDVSKALFPVLEERGIDEGSIQMIMKHHPRVIARKDSVSRITKRNTHKRYVDQQFRIALPFKCRHKFTSPEDGDEYFYGFHFTRYPNGEVHAHAELIVAISDSYSADRMCPMVTDSMQVDYEKVQEEEEATNYNTFMTEGTNVDHPRLVTGIDRLNCDQSSSMYTKQSTKVSVISSTVKSNGSSSSTSRKSAIKSPSTRKSSSRNRKSLALTNISLSNNQNQIPPTVEIIQQPSEDAITGPTYDTSIVSFGDGTFMTPNDNGDFNDNMSIDNSTIRTLDPYVYSSQELVSNDKKKAAKNSTGSAKSTKSIKSASKSAKSAKSVSSTSRSKSRTRSKKMVGTNIDDRSRSGRSNSSVSSASSDTPSRNNLTSLKVDLMKKVTPYKDEFYTPKIHNLDSLTIPKELAPQIDASVRLTRQQLKRLNETGSHSSDESHQRQSKKAQRT